MYIQFAPKSLKEDYAKDIAKELRIPEAQVSNGGTIVSEFLDRVSETLSGQPTGEVDSYRKAEHVLGLVGEIYDPWWDSSEAQGATGGGTVTARAYSRILDKIRGSRRCFVVPSQVVEGESLTYTFQTSPSGNALAIAGPESNLLFVEQTRAGARALGVGTVLRIDPGWSAPWTVEWSYAPFDEPKPFRISEPLNRVREITLGSFESFGLESSRLVDVSRPVYEEEVAERISSEFPAPRVQINRIKVPDVTPNDAPISPLMEPQYRSTGDPTEAPEMVDAGPRNGTAPIFYPPRDRGAARQVEQRGVQIALRSLEEDGWSLVRDCQRDGVGYDFLFQRDRRIIKVEVKGIQGRVLEFNLTPKEWWRACTDPDWYLVAVNGALSPTSARVSILTGRDLRVADRSVVSYRVRPIF